MYTSLLRHLIALPIAMKQRMRAQTVASEYARVLLPTEASLVLESPSPHLVLLASCSTIIQPLKAQDDGSGKDLAVWGELERGLSELQAAACQLDLVALLPPPASYSLLTARFLFLWLATLPFVLIDLMRPFHVPLVMAGVSWALYSTEELAKLLDRPFGSSRQHRAPSTRASWREPPARGGVRRADTDTDTASTTTTASFTDDDGPPAPEIVPLDDYCNQIVSELKQQMVIARTLNRRVAGGDWVVTSLDVEPVRRQGGFGSAGGGRGTSRRSRAAAAEEQAADDEYGTDAVIKGDATDVAAIDDL